MWSMCRSTIVLQCLAVTLFSLSAVAGVVYPVTYPGEAPGKAEGSLTSGGAMLGNNALQVHWRLEEGRLELGRIVDLGVSKKPRAAGRNLFRCFLDIPDTADYGATLESRDFRVLGEPELVRVEANPGARRLSERFAGWEFRANLQQSGSSHFGGVRAEYVATLRDESNYVTQRLTLLSPREDLPIEELVLVDLRAGGARQWGVTQGAPVVAGNVFFAYEHPMATNALGGGYAACSLKRSAVLKAGAALTQTSVIGVVPEGQLRRGFLYYVERERAHPYRPFLHYNSWYDIAWGDRKFDEAQSIEAIDVFGEELVRKRGATMDSFVFDDGWDDNKTLWQFHEGFPKGFGPLRDEAGKYGSTVGVWLSPFGGYGEARKQRLQYGREQGFEINRGGFSLSGERYYERFRAICEEMIREYGVNFFKFDGMGTGGRASSEGGGEFLPDIEALMRLVGELRDVRPDLYVSATTGTWCSPYFLWHADSTWRGAGDMGFHGTGSKRQQWITYRDLYTFRNVVAQGPLYPLNSLMTQGIAQARHGHAAALGEDIAEFGDEVWSFFGSGTGLQELYIAPGLLSDAQWEILAKGARWARENADVFVDVHWIGGDPGEEEVYGWASWSPRKGILVLRNPGEQSRDIEIDVAEAFELPDGAAERYRLTDPRVPGRRGAASLVLTSSRPHSFALSPYEVVVFDAVPDSEETAGNGGE